AREGSEGEERGSTQRPGFQWRGPTPRHSRQDPRSASRRLAHSGFESKRKVNPDHVHCKPELGGAVVIKLQNCGKPRDGACDVGDLWDMGLPVVIDAVG